MVEAFRPIRGGWIHAFGASWFITEFLRGNGPMGTPRIDPSKGAPQSDIHSAYKLALHTSIADDLAVKDIERAQAAGNPLTNEEEDARRRYYLERIPSRLTRMRYSSFRVYFGLLKRLGWVERTGEEEASLPQEYDPNFDPRVYYRLTAGGVAAEVPQVFDPVMVLYPHYTREKRSGKRRRYFSSVPTRRPPPKAAPPAHKPAPVALPPKKAVAKPPPAKKPAPPPAALPAFTFPERLNRASADKLIKHLGLMEGKDVSTPEAKAQMKRLEKGISNWRGPVEEAHDKEEAKDNPNEDRLETLQEQLDALDEVSGALENYDIGSAIDALQGLFPPAVAKKKPAPKAAPVSRPPKKAAPRPTPAPKAAPVKPPAKPAPPTAKKKMTAQEAWNKYLAGELTRRELAEYDPTVHLTPGKP